MPGKNIILGAIISVVVIAAVVGFLLYFEREKPEVTIEGEVDLVGLKKNYTLSANDRDSGLRKVEIKVLQKDLEKTIMAETFKRQGKRPSAGPENWKTTFSLDTEELGLQDGPAELVVSVRDYSLWSFFQGNLRQKVYALEIDTKSPKVSRMTSSRYIKPGGSGIVVYSVSGESEKHGVRLNGYFHPGSPLPGGKEGQYVAMIGLPYDTEKIDDLRVEARDKAGNTGRARFGIVLKDAEEKHDRINIPDSFLDWKIPEFSSYLEGIEGNKIDKFLYINETVRGDNNRRISELCSEPEEKRYWKGRFLRMSGKRMSRYADRRTYYYEGRAIDKQVHLGVDLASSRHADVNAANHGKVEFADSLGIYGNTVIIDHGLGVFSLYAHLNNMAASPGDLVKTGEKIGTTDTTGMAGGDHLHFSMLINGVFVDPVEWWDQHWIDVSILSHLP